MRWYKHSPDKWLSGTRGMSFEQKGLHADLISLYIDRDGNLPDDDQTLIRILCCRPQVWRRLKEQLISINKLRVACGKLIPNGAETSLKLARNLSNSQSLQGKKPMKSTTDANQKTIDYRDSSTNEEVQHPLPKRGFQKLNGEASPAGQLPPGSPVQHSRPAERRKDHQAEKDAERRKRRQAWEADLVRELGPDDYAYAIDVLASDPRLADRATDAELRQSGSGAQVALIAVDRYRKAC
jgi:uncharacterized protein YdaU (DUF1376 family)